MEQPERLGGVFKFLLLISGLMLVALFAIAVIAWGQGFGNDDRQSSPSNTILSEQFLAPEAQTHEGDSGIINDVDEQDHLTAEEILINTETTMTDLYALAEKYHGVKDTPVMQAELPVVFQDGESRDFWILNVNTNKYRPAQAVLAYQTEHVYFWVEDGIEYSERDVTRLVDTFEEQIYPRNHLLFGTEYSPGVDKDVHLTILYADQLGGAAGYFSASDSNPAEIDDFSNRTEMFYLSAEHLELGNSYVYGVMAHEFQHMIHWNMDRDETAWINEGLSELAVDMNGFDLGGFTFMFALNPDLQLNFWPGSEQGSSTPHYGASYLFIKYLHSLYGDDFIKSLVAQPENGFSGIEAVLEEKEIVIDHEEFPSEALFQRWSVDNWLLSRDTDGELSDYQWALIGLPISQTQELSCDDDTLVERVNQFGTEYIAINCDDDYEISLEWNETVPVLPIDPYSGKQYFWSNRGDTSSMRLSRSFDLTFADESITMNFWTWFDIEKDYDYLYLNVKDEDGRWHNLVTPSCTREDPTGANFGCGYNGKSEGWVQEEVDLSAFAGQVIAIEFEYITDAAVNGEGFVLDDVSIEAIGYQEGFENGAAGWEADGFALIQNELSQRMGISVLDRNNPTEISPIIQAFPANIKIPIDEKENGDPVILVLNGLTQYTHIPAEYSLRVSKLP